MIAARTEVKDPAWYSKATYVIQLKIRPDSSSVLCVRAEAEIVNFATKFKTTLSLSPALTQNVLCYMQQLHYYLSNFERSGIDYPLADLTYILLARHIGQTKGMSVNVCLA